MIKNLPKGKECVEVTAKLPRKPSKKGLVTEKLTKYDVQKTSSKENQKRQEQKKPKNNLRLSNFL